MDDATWLKIVEELEKHMKAIMVIAKENNLSRLDIKALPTTGWVSADVRMDCVHYAADISEESITVSREYYAKSGSQSKILRYGGF